MNYFKNILFSSSYRLMGSVLTTATLLTLIPSSTQAETNILTQTNVIWQQPSVGFPTADPFSPLKYFNGSVYFVWVDASYRPWLTKVTKGVVKNVPLEAPDYKVQPDGHHRFSLGIDNNGYIHVSGDMHNYNALTTGVINPYPDRLQKQQILYWKSYHPESIGGGFYFAGGLNATTAIPGSGWIYPRFFSDNHGELYMSSLMHGIEYGNYSGEMAVGLYRYDTSTQTWTALGGKPDHIPKGTIYNTALYWEEAGIAPTNWFQGYRPHFFFDKDNHMHFSCSVCSSNAFAGNDRVIYAASKDNGVTWEKANGDQIPGLPIRGAAGEPNIGDVVLDTPSTPNLGADTAIAVDANGALAVYTSNNMWYGWTGSAWTPQTSLNFSPQVSPDFATLSPSNHLLMSSAGTAKLMRMQDLKSRTFGYDYTLGYGFPNYSTVSCIDQFAYHTTGVVYAVTLDNATGTQSILQTTFTAAPLPQGWGDVDIAKPLPNFGGLAAYQNGTFTLYSYGSVIDNNSDNFHFTYQKLSGDCTIIAKMNADITSAQGYCRAGIMIRETLDPASKNVAQILAPGTNSGGALFGVRDTTGGNTYHTTATPPTPISTPYWVKLVRAGNEFTGYVSSDGVNWVLQSQQTVVLNPVVYVGLAAASYANTYLMEQVQFTNVSIQ